MTFKKQEIKDVKVISATYTHEKNTIISSDNVNHLTGYALSWLHLTNNAREYSSVFLSHSNSSSNGIEVVTTIDEEQNVKEYLEMLGFIPWDVETRKMVVVGADFGYSDPDWVDTAMFVIDVD